jgi:hypothetical protein
MESASQHDVLHFPPNVAQAHPFHLAAGTLRSLLLPNPLRLGRKSVFHVHRPHNKKDSTFFSHGSAIWIHGLNEDHKNIFINNEQSPKPKPSSYH